MLDFVKKLLDQVTSTTLFLLLMLYDLIWETVMRMLKSGIYTISEIARKTGISRQQIYRIKNRII